MNWYLAALKKYAVFSGRAQRKEYWFFGLFNSLILLALGFVESDESVLTTLFALAVVTPSIAVTVRRLHDTGKSAWWLLIGLIPLVGNLILFFYMIEDSDVGQNAYGSDPKVTRLPKVSDAAVDPGADV